MEHGFDSRRRYQKSSSFDEDFFCLYSLSLRYENKLRTHTKQGVSTEFVHIAKAME